MYWRIYIVSFFRARDQFGMLHAMCLGAGAEGAAVPYLPATCRRSDPLARCLSRAPCSSHRGQWHRSDNSFYAGRFLFVFEVEIHQLLPQDICIFGGSIPSMFLHIFLFAKSLSPLFPAFPSLLFRHPK